MEITQRSDMVALVFLKPGAGICFWASEQLVNAPVHEFSKFSGPQNYPGGLLGISWVLVSEFTPQWPSPLSLDFEFLIRPKRRCRGSHGGHTWRTPCWLSAPFGTSMNLLHLSAPSALPFLQWFSSLYCEALQMILQQGPVWEALLCGFGLLDMTWSPSGFAIIPSLPVVQILKKPVDPVYLSLHT